MYRIRVAEHQAERETVRSAAHGIKTNVNFSISGTVGTAQHSTVSPTVVVSSQDSPAVAAYLKRRLSHHISHTHTQRHETTHRRDCERLANPLRRGGIIEEGERKEASKSQPLSQTDEHFQYWLLFFREPPSALREAYRLHSFIPQLEGRDGRFVGPSVH